MVKINRIFVLFYFLILQQIFSQTVSVSASTDTSKYLVGDYINYKIEVSYPEGTEIAIPAFQDSLKDVEFIKSNPLMTGDDGKMKRNVYSYIFSVYDSAQITIPAIPVEFKSPGDKKFKKMETNPVSFLVEPMEVNMQEDIQDVKAPIKIPLDWVFVLILTLIVLALAAAGFFGYKYYQKKKKPLEKQKIKIVIPPHKEALAALYTLGEKKLWQQGLIKDYHSEITGIIRTYFEKRFNFLAMEMPSSEVLEKLKLLNEAQPIFDETKLFFENADLVKFAKFEPMPSVNEDMMKEALNIVKTTKQEEQSEKPNV